MATTKLYDLAVKTGEYESNGQTKGRYENVGSVMRTDDGNQFLLLKRTFNPAGVLGDRDTVLVSCFEPRAQGGNRSTSGGQSPAPRGDDTDFDNIPF